MEEAEKLFTETYWMCCTRFGDIHSFRNVARLGLPAATNHVYNQNLKFADEFINDPQYIKTFEDKEEASEMFGGINGLSGKLTTSQLESFTSSVDAASLVFAHSILDGAALNYCRCSVLVSPSDWQRFIGNKKVTINEIRDLSCESIIKNKIDDYIRSLDRESLLTKAERLFQVCNPPDRFAPLKNYLYDKERLETIDEKRHDIVHKSNAITPFPNTDNDIRFLQQTANYFMSLVNHKYSLKIKFSLLQQICKDEPK